MFNLYGNFKSIIKKVQYLRNSKTMLRKLWIPLMTVLILSSCARVGDNESEAEQKDQKIFRYNQADGLSSLDPAFARNQANCWVSTQLYSGLFELSEDLYTVPNLVDTWKISEDGKTYTFNIKKGIHFHDSEVFPDGKGREVKASDFVYSFKRILDPKTASTGAWIFNDKAKKDANGKADENWVEAANDYQLLIHLHEPFGPFLEILTMPYTFVVPEEAVEKYGKDFRINPVGTGPFQFKSWDEGNSLILVKNKNYWRKDDNGKALPYLDAVQVSFIADKNQELLTFQQKKLDFVSYSGQPNSIDIILNNDGTPTRDFTGKFVVQKEPYLNTEYIGFQLDPSKYEDKNHPILNKNFRKALNYAINREEMVSYLLNNLGVPGNAGIMPPAVAAYDAEKVKGYAYDIKKAEALLSEAGYPGGKGLPELKLYTTIQSKPMVEYLQKQWEAIGVKVAIEINQVPTHQELVDNSRVHFFRGSWLGDYPDAENYLSMFYSQNKAPIGPNKTHFENIKFDSLYNQARFESEGFKRFDYYLAMDNIIMEEAPVIVLFYDEVLRLTQNNVIGLTPTNPMNVLKLEKVDFMQGGIVQQGL